MHRLPSLAEIQAIAVAAGAQIMPFFHTAPDNDNIGLKADNSPVTEADLAAHEYLCGELKRLAPGYRIISEEGVGHAEADQSHFWLVDPLDGTREFLRRSTEFTVNIALIESGRPILAVVACPALGTVYSAEKGKGAWRTDSEGTSTLIHTRPYNPKASVAYVSRTQGQTTAAKIRDRWPLTTLTPASSAIKMCWMAEGAADFYFREHPSMGWDTAAPDLVLWEAGGQMLNLQGRPLPYQGHVLTNPAWVAMGDRTFDWKKF